MDYQIDTSSSEKSVTGLAIGFCTTSLVLIDDKGNVQISLYDLPQQAVDLIPGNLYQLGGSAWKVVLNARVVFNLLPLPSVEEVYAEDPPVFDPLIPVETQVDLNEDWHDVDNEPMPEMDGCDGS